MANEAKKYELVRSESIVHINGKTLYRIRALVCALLEEISNALEKIKKSKRFNKEVDNQ